MTFQIRFKTHYFDSKGPLTAPSLYRLDSLQWGLAGMERLERIQRKAIWRDSPDMGHYFQRGAFFQITKKDIFLLYFPAQSISSWKCPPPPPIGLTAGGQNRGHSRDLMRVTHAAANLARNSGGLQAAEDLVSSRGSLTRQRDACVCRYTSQEPR